MANKNYDFEMYQGTDKILEFNIIASDGSSKDLTGGSAFWVLFGSLSGDNKVIKSVGDGITIDGSKILITINAIDTDNLIGKFYHELRAIDNNGFNEVVAAGYVTIKSSKTKGLGG